MADKLSKITQIIKTAITKKSVLDAAGKSAVESIVKRTRLGRGVGKNLGSSSPLPRLKESTVKTRKYLKQKGQLTGPNATPAKSGLNRTGELLNSVEYKISSGSVNIELADKANKDKATDLIKIDKDYTFMNLSKPEFARMIKAMSDQVAKILKRININKL